MLTGSWIERWFAWWPLRLAAAIVILGRAAFHGVLARKYRAFADVCWVGRVSAVAPLQDLARRYIFRALARFDRQRRNLLADWFLADRSAAEHIAGYSLDDAGDRQLMRDVMVLKGWRPAEKGVLLLKYNRTFDAAMSLLDMPKILGRYYLVLEPSWAGYADPSILMYFTPGHPVLVQCFTDDDFAFISRAGSPLVPVRLGPADWVNADLFRPPPQCTREYDVVMVANWGRHKRHETLFRALADIRDRTVRTLLVGFPWNGRTARDIQDEAARIVGPRHPIEIEENLSQRALAERLCRCKCFVFLSRKEGDNKALVEAMFADVPAIVYCDTIGGARSRVNAATGILSSDSELAASIRFMLDHHRDYSARQWALRNTGSRVATQKLAQAIEEVAVARGDAFMGPIAEKANAPNLTYVDATARDRFGADYEFLVASRRSPSSSS